MFSAVCRVTPGDASSQATFLTRCAREHGVRWPRQATQRYAGELLLRTAYSAYRVIDGRCIVVQRAGMPMEDDTHECLGTYLVGYLTRQDDASGPQWTLQERPRERAKAVFWRPTKQGHGHFVVTSRLDIAPDTERADAAPAAAARAPGRSSPPPLPVRARPLSPAASQPTPPAPIEPWVATTPTAGVMVPAAARANKLPPRPPQPGRGATRPTDARKHAPAPPPPRCMKGNVRA